MLASESKKLRHELGVALRRPGRRFEVAADILAAGPEAGDFEIDEHGLQQVVEIVRDAAAQLPDGLELVGLLQRLFRAPALGSPLPVGALVRRLSVNDFRALPDFEAQS